MTLLLQVQFLVVVQVALLLSSAVSLKTVRSLVMQMGPKKTSSQQQLTQQQAPPPAVIYSSSTTSTSSSGDDNDFVQNQFEYLAMEYRSDNYKTTLATQRIGTSVENSPALVLNADYSPLSFTPLSLWSWQDTLRAVFSDRAVVISTYADLLIRGVSQTYPVPSVIALKQYHRMPSDREPALSRRNVYLRDSFRCQYCLHKFPVEKLSLDHVIPRSKGGKLTWTNTVSACCDCNFKKGTTLPEDLPRLGMRLRSLPRAPTYHELQAKSKGVRKSAIHPHWTDYME